MSGIAGVWNLGGRPVDKAELNRMADSLAHRGPDGSGVWSEGAVGLAHCMLSATPEAMYESLPMTNRRGDLAITADARIDNRDELISSLAIGGPATEVGDSELILGAYEKWGEDCPTKLVGDFAFAIWDDRIQRLFCARDHFGVKPFYYYFCEDTFVFASEIKGIFQLSQIPRRINQARIADFLVMQTEPIDRTCTFYEDVLRLPAAHSMLVRRRQRELRSYWSLDPAREIRHSSDEECTEAFLEVFGKAVECRLRGATGSMLSGGLDSSAVVGMAHKLLTERDDRLQTFSAVAKDETDCAETRSVNATISGLLGLEPCKITPEQFSTFLPDVDRALQWTDDLFDMLLLDTRLMTYSAARQRGLRSLLDGVDGDIVTSHREAYLRFLLRAGALKTAVAEASGYSTFFACYTVGSPWQLLYKHGRAAFVPLALRKLGLRLLGRKTKLGDLTKDSIINLDFAARIRLAERFETNARNRSPEHVATLREHHMHTIVAPFVTVALERYDRVASVFSIEPRHPFLDKRLAEYCLALPWRQLVHRGRQKHVLRRSMAGILPEEVRNCGKIRAGPRIRLPEVWLAENRDLLAESLFDRRQDLEEFVDLPLVQRSYEQYISGSYSQDDTYSLWQTAVLALWLRRDRHRVTESACSAAAYDCN